MTEIREEIKNEIDFIKKSKIKTFTDHYDLTVCLRALTNQLQNCFSTSEVKYVRKILLRMAGQVCVYFDSRKETVSANHRDFESLGKGIVAMEIAVRQLEQYAISDAAGDCRSQFMVISSFLLGLLDKTKD